MSLRGAAGEQAHSWPYAVLLHGALSVKVEYEETADKCQEVGNSNDEHRIA